MYRRWRMALAVVGFIAAAAVVVPASPAGAVELSTDYPAVTAGPGDSVTFDLRAISPRRERVELAVVEVPEQWSARLVGGGRPIGAVTADPTSSPPVQVVVSVPEDARAGTGRVVVRATAASGAQDLALEVTVAEGTAAEAGLEAQFPRLQGGTTDTFRFDLTIRNDSAQAATFGLEARGPEGWVVSARPAAQEQAATITVEPGATGSVQVEADPPDSVEAGSYPIVVQASSAGQTLEQELTVDIAGSFQLALATANERLDTRGQAGSITSVELLVRNDGTAPIENVTFSASPPTGWEVTFQPESVASVEPGGAVPVTANIRPGGDAVAGDYVVSLSSSGSGETASVDLRFAVASSFRWGLVGVLVILAALGGLVFVFRRFGRR